MTPFEAARQISAIEAAQKLGLPTKRSGSRYVTLCPFHADRRPSLTLYPGTGGFYCFSCQAHGDAISLYQQVLGLKPLDAARRLCEDFSLTYEDHGAHRRRAPPSAPKADVRMLRQKVLTFREKRAKELVEMRAEMKRRMDEREDEMYREHLPFEEWWDDPVWSDAMQNHARLEDALLQLDALSVRELWEIYQAEEESNGTDE